MLGAKIKHRDIWFKKKLYLSNSKIFFPAYASFKSFCVLKQQQAQQMNSEFWNLAAITLQNSEMFGMMKFMKMLLAIWKPTKVYQILLISDGFCDNYWLIKFSPKFMPMLSRNYPKLPPTRIGNSPMLMKYEIAMKRVISAIFWVSELGRIKSTPMITAY